MFESFEGFDSCIFVRKVLSGEYSVINKHLVEDLTKLKLWNKEMKDLINEISVYFGEVPLDDVKPSILKKPTSGLINIKDSRL